MKKIIIIKKSQHKAICGRLFVANTRFNLKQKNTKYKRKKKWNYFQYFFLFIEWLTDPFYDYTCYIGNFIFICLTKTISFHPNRCMKCNLKHSCYKFVVNPNKIKLHWFKPRKIIVALTFLTSFTATRRERQIKFVSFSFILKILNIGKAKKQFLYTVN